MYWKKYSLNVKGNKPYGRLLNLTLLLCASLFVLSACSKKVEEKELPRPVRVMEAQFSSIDAQTEFSGDVRARVESRLGFRVPGKIVTRMVDVGSVVKKGQVLMRIDAQDLVLVKSQAQASLSAAESQRDLAKAELKRYQELKDKQFVSGSILESKETSFKAAHATYLQAQATFQLQSNQASYSQLVADVDGVITSIDADVGQVVAAGAPVVKIAQAGEMEVVVGVPEDKVNSIAELSEVQVRLWADTQRSFSAKLRELSPIADPITRTFTAKVSLPKSLEGVRLGMTATVQFSKSKLGTAIRLPLTALLKEKNHTAVWIVENNAVRLIPVQIANTIEQDVLIASGLQAGQLVVTAGVHFLQSGQKVKVLDKKTIPNKASVSESPSNAKLTEEKQAVAPASMGAKK
jgi:RND family efflux transporter MFP subunit